MSLHYLVNTSRATTELLVNETRPYHVRNEYCKFFKVAYRHYSGQMKNVYRILQQIYSGNCVTDFIRIAGAL